MGDELKMGRAKASRKRKQQMEEQIRETLEKHRQDVAQPELPEPEADPVQEPAQAELEPQSIYEKALKVLTELPEQFKALKLESDKLKSEISDLKLENSKLNRKTKSLGEDLQAARRRAKQEEELNRALGFGYVKDFTWQTPRTNVCPYCKNRPTLQKEKAGDCWMVICDHCWTRSEGADGPMATIKNWNDGKESEISQMLNRPLKEAIG